MQAQAAVESKRAKTVVGAVATGEEKRVRRVKFHVVVKTPDGHKTVEFDRKRDLQKLLVASEKEVLAIFKGTPVHYKEAKTFVIA